MPTQTLSYGSASDPLLLQHACEAPIGVTVSGRTSLGTALDLQPGVPFRHTISPPLPQAIQILYVVIGPPLAAYQIETRITQLNTSQQVTERGTLSSAGTASHHVTLALAQPQAASAPSRAPTRVPSPPEEDEDLPESDSFQRKRPSQPAPAPAPPKPARAGGSTRMPDQDSSTRPEKGRYTVWFGTNREPVYERGSLTGFSSERSETVHYGSCRVAIPESHTIGSIGSSWWKRLITRTDDRLKLLTLTTLRNGAYWGAIAAELRARRSDDRDAVVFLHGYNVSFQDAALRAAQIGFDLGVSGVMAFYSWPSKGTLQGYPADEATIEASEGFIADFLSSMAERSGARRVHIIAHSMGNRGLLRAIDRIATAAAERTRTPFDQIVLAAADVDQDTFKRLSAAYHRVARRTTMYVCSKDRAVEASHWLHDFPRAGLAPPVLVVPGIDTINVSNLDLTLLGHGYVAEARELLTDIHALLRDGSPPAQRFGLRKVTSPAGEYWVVGR
jgi:esterase/lipase superfamily enzyme